MKPPPIAELARRWGVSRQTVYNWRKAGVDVYDEDAVKAHRATARSDGGGGAKRLDELEADKARLLKARAARAEHEAEKARIAIAQQRGELVTAESQFNAGLEWGTRVKERVLALENELPPLLGGLSASQMVKPLRKKLYETLTELSDLAAQYNK